MREYLNTAVLGARRSAIREYSALAARTPGCFSLTLGEPGFDTPLPILETARAALLAHETHYIENSGAPALRRRIAAFERERNGMDYDEGEVIVTAGATQALFLALFGILNPGDEVIIPLPAFPLYEEIVRLCRGVPVFLDTSADGFQLRRDRLDPLVTERTKAIILNSPNNPTGCVYTGESLRAVHDAAAGRPLFVICDDVYRQLVYTEDYHSFAEFRDLRQKLLVVQSFSKPYAMTGWRMGYLLADRGVKERLELVHQFMLVSTPAPFQGACVTALEFDPHELVETCGRRRSYIVERLREMELPAAEPMGAFYVFPSIREFGLPSGEFCTRMIREAGLAATPGACFGGEGHIRLAYCCGGEELREGLDRLERFVRSLRGAEHEH